MILNIFLNVQGIIDAVDPKHKICVQRGAKDSTEDCLILNIWSAQPVNNSSSELKNVMFWIHGGGMVSGSIYDIWFDGRFLATHDVVVVSTNYRLGALSFLYGGTEDSPGNLAFYDQQLAIKWVKFGENLPRTILCDYLSIGEGKHPFVWWR